MHECIHRTLQQSAVPQFSLIKQRRLRPNQKSRCCGGIKMECHCHIKTITKQAYDRHDNQQAELSIHRFSVDSTACKMSSHASLKIDKTATFDLENHPVWSP